MTDQPQPVDEARLQKMAEMLDQQSTWPTDYLYKFIVPIGLLDEVKALFPEVALKVRESRTGKYVSVSALQKVDSSEAVIAVYRRAALVPGLIAL